MLDQPHLLLLAQVLLRIKDLIMEISLIDMIMMKTCLTKKLAEVLVMIMVQITLLYDPIEITSTIPI